MYYYVGSVALGGSLLAGYALYKSCLKPYSKKASLPPKAFVLEATPLSQALNGIRLVLDYLGDETLKTQGIWRESGERTKARSIAYYLKESTAPILKSRSYNAFDVTSALKILMDEAFPIIELDDGTFINQGSALAVSSNASEIHKLFKNKIKELINQGKTQEAELLHNFMHCAHRAQSFSEQNRMTANNIARIFAPSFLALINPADKPLVSANDLNRVIPLIEKLVTNPKLSERFDKEAYLSNPVFGMC